MFIICTQLNGFKYFNLTQIILFTQSNDCKYCYVSLTIQLNIRHLFAHCWNVKHVRSTTLDIIFSKSWWWFIKTETLLRHFSFALNSSLSITFFQFFSIYIYIHIYIYIYIYIDTTIYIYIYIYIYRYNYIWIQFFLKLSTNQVYLKQIIWFGCFVANQMFMVYLMPKFDTKNLCIDICFQVTIPI